MADCPEGLSRDGTRARVPLGSPSLLSGSALGLSLPTPSASPARELHPVADSFSLALLARACDHFKKIVSLAIAFLLYITFGCVSVTNERRTETSTETTQMATKQITGSELKIGDVIATWAGKKRIVALKNYTGPLSYLWPEGARLADFDMGGGMTIPNADRVETVSF